MPNKMKNQETESNSKMQSDPFKIQIQALQEPASDATENLEQQDTIQREGLCYRCKHCDKQNAIVDMDQKKKSWYCSWCSRQNVFIDLTAAEKEEFLTTLYRRTVDLIERKKFLTYYPEDLHVRD